MNQSKTKKLFIVSLVLIVSLILAYGAIWYSVHVKQKETATLYAASNQQESDQEKIRELEGTLKDTKESRAKLDEYFIQKANTVTFIEYIEQLGKDAGVALTVSSVTDAPKGSVGIQLDFSAAGSFSGLYRLIALVELMPYKIALKKADVQRVETDGQWRGNFTIMLESFLAVNSAEGPLAATGEVPKK
ncbi:MAG: hypothetical protein HYT94_00210 [Parcubacteria group bacterium]|nr:hypothetical protein [Parcubacteria group bacterium]